MEKVATESKLTLEEAQRRLPDYVVQAMFLEHGRWVAWTKEEILPVPIPDANGLTRATGARYNREKKE